ncbi:uncharacterized protein LOC124795946 [Schistocerca piceifrons]|uniref:uncharacterized protein LOC124795946 n=1 Tax=Schistocerca piceifrons TaxID=274613 RepID=UPI001F5E92F0|nr:uncharacterized protein LOC124795946 [Schistocerca piceifrons]
MYSLRRLTDSELNKVPYKQYRHKNCKEVRILKAERISQQVLDSDSVAKTCWSIVNKIRNSETETEINNVQLTVNNDDISDSFLPSNTFNNYFIDTVKNDVSMKQYIQHTFESNNKQNCSRLPVVSTYDILQLIDSLRNKKSAGLDKISPYLLKQCKYKIMKPLAHLINCVLEDGMFPDKMKLAVVKPIHKKGEVKHVQNYKPIALISTFSTLIEKITLKKPGTLQQC